MLQLLLPALLALLWVPIYLYLAFYYLVFFLRDRFERSHVFFALLCLCLAWYSFGAYGFYGAQSFAEALPWQRFELLGAIFGFPTIALFIKMFTRTPFRRWVFYAFYGAALVFATLDLFTPWFFTDVPMIREFELMGTMFRYLDATPGWAGILAFAWGALLAVHSLWIAFTAWRNRDPRILPVFGGLLLLVLCVVNDILVASGAYLFFYLTEHGFVLFAFSVAYAHQLRFLAAQHERRQERRRLKLLSEVAGAVNRTENLDEILEAVGDRLKGHVPVDRISLSLLDERTGEMQVRAALGARIGDIAVGDRSPMDEILPPRMFDGLRRGEVTVIPDATRAPAPPDGRERISSSGLRSVAMLPLRAEDELVGIVNLASREPDAYTPEHVELMEHMAEDLALAVIRSRLFRDLQARQAELEAAYEDLQSLDSMKSDLLANVSHELRTPLVSIRGYVEMMLGGKLGPVSERQEKGLRVSLRNAGRLLGLIENLLDYSKLKDGKVKIEQEPVDLRQVLEECLDAVLPRADEHGLTIERDLYADGPLTVTGDRARLGQVFDNLLTNAIKFNRKDGVVRVEAGFGRSGWIRAAISDTGVGIADVDQHRIFDRFFQVDSSSTRRAGGTGIGLPIVREIVELHGGEVKVRSKAGQGSTFVVVLPARN